VGQSLNGPLRRQPAELAREPVWRGEGRSGRSVEGSTDPAHRRGNTATTCADPNGASGARALCADHERDAHVVSAQDSFWNRTLARLRAALQAERPSRRAVGASAPQYARMWREVDPQMAPFGVSVERKKMPKSLVA
jgi:hypothetical protein